MRRKIWFVLVMVLTLLLAAGMIDTALAAPKPQSVTISREDYTMDISRWKYTTLKGTVSPSGASQLVTWKSSNTSVATINSTTGKLTALKPGVTTITCTARGTGVKSSIVLTVINSKLPESLTFEQSEIDLNRYQTYKLTPVILPDTASKSVTWKSSNNSVATVSSTGTITAINKGTCTITCTSKEGSSVRASVVVKVTNQSTPKSITLPSVSAMYIGDTMVLEPEILPEGACPYVTYKSSNTGVLSVSSSGKLTAKKAGTATITVTSRQSGRITASKKIVVVPVGSPLSIEADETYITLNPGKTATLTATVLPETANQGLKYKSSNTAIVGVSSSGKIIARSAGTATITIYSSVNSNVKDTVKVKVANLPAPTSIVISAENTTINKGDKLQLVASPMPTTADARFTFKSSNTSRATVSSSGLVTAKSGGYVTITVTSQRNSRITGTIKLFVYDEVVPTKITLDGSSVVLDTTQYLTLKADVEPATAAGSVKWTSSNSTVVGVSSTGKLYARSVGTATITCRSTYDSSVKDTYYVRVVNRSAPSSITVSAADGYLKVGETLEMDIGVSPSTASTLFVCTSSNTAIATVTNNGKITAVKEGTCTITVASKKKSTVKKSFTLRVYSSDVPVEIQLSTTSANMGPGDAMTVTAKVLPATANQTVTWKSSNSGVAAVDSNGRITAKAAGSATITATAGNVSEKVTVTVLPTTKTTTIPERTTSIAGINTNMAKIEAIRLSAINELASLKASGVITATEYTDRAQVVTRAFEMQAFPWMTSSIQEYWSSAYAYKRFYTGKVYYGLPYIQCGTNGVYTNRQYNVAKALAQGYYTSSGSGYYNMSRTKKLNGMYVGNDCSAFVSMSQWGTSHQASYLNTTSIATTSYYKTISSWTNMRPGDLMVKSGNHTVLFLYYTNSAKTSAMIIEQGGDGNTVICSVHELSKYKSKGYIIRRKTTYK